MIPSRHPLDLFASLSSARNYFVAHAPPLPDEVRTVYLESLRINEPEAMCLPWNEYTLGKLATQEARWRVAYADALIRELQKEPSR